MALLASFVAYRMGIQARMTPWSAMLITKVGSRRSWKTWASAMTFSMHLKNATLPPLRMPQP
jgi:hypothetical protein